MLTYAKIALLFLQISKRILDYLEKHGYVNEGYDKATAQIAAGILARSKYAKEIMESHSRLDDPAVDKLLRDLEPN